MKNIIIQATETLQKMVWAKVALYSLASLCMSWLSVTNGINNYSELTELQKISMYVGCIGSWGFTMVAFLDKGIADASKGHVPFTGGDDQIIKSTDSSSVELNQATGQVVKQQQSETVTAPVADVTEPPKQ